MYKFKKYFQFIFLVGYFITLKSSTLMWENDDKISIFKINDMSHPIFKKLQLCYECEFAPITKTQMMFDGDYDQAEIASHWSKSADIYLLFIDSIPAGFCVVNEHSMIEENKLGVHDFAEFYVTPIFRRQNYGSIFAHAVLNFYGGSWEIRQFPEKEKSARIFWLKVISEVPHKNFEEIINHAKWQGFVQKFDMV